MPRLLVFAPCEKVIISQDENTPSLVSVLTGMRGELELEAKLKPDSVIPVRWAIFAMWKQVPEDGAREFEETFILRSPSGKIPISKSTLLFTTQKESNRTVVHMPGIPIGENGEWTIELYLNDKGATIPAVPLATYPIEFSFVVKEKSS